MFLIGGGAPPPTLYSLDEIMLNYSSFHHLKLKSNEWKKYMRGSATENHKSCTLEILKKNIQGFNYDFYPRWFQMIE